MESLSILGVIYRAAKEITKAANGARQCKRRCQEVARRVEVIANLVRESEAAPNDSATRSRVLDRLNLKEALKVVQSCRSRSFPKLLLAGSSANSSIDKVERNINNCLQELGVANNVRLLGLGNQQTTTARRLAAHDDVPMPKPNTVVHNSGIVKCLGDSSSSRRSRRRSHSRRAKRIRKAAALAAGSQVLSTTGPAASDMYRTATTKRSESNASSSTENQVCFPHFKANGPWTPPPLDLQDCQYSYGGASDHGGGLVHYYCNHYSIENDPNSCSIM